MKADQANSPPERVSGTSRPAATLDYQDRVVAAERIAETDRAATGYLILWCGIVSIASASTMAIFEWTGLTRDPEADDAMWLMVMATMMLNLMCSAMAILGGIVVGIGSNDDATCRRCLVGILTGNAGFVGFCLVVLWM